MEKINCYHLTLIKEYLNSLFCYFNYSMEHFTNLMHVMFRKIITHSVPNITGT